MPKFFVSPNNISDKEVIINGGDAKHITAVLRSKIGDGITACDGNGNDYRCAITELSRDEVRAKIISFAKSDAEPKTKITLFQGLPKADKMELIIQKAVELGVTDITPVLCARSVAKLENAAKTEKKTERWQKIAESAAKQSGRGIIPKINSPISFAEAVKQADGYDGKIIPYEMEKANGLKAFANGFKGESVAVFIGPEGGFEQSEINFAAENKVIPVTLGNRILRTETAGISVISILIYELG